MVFSNSVTLTQKSPRLLRSLLFRFSAVSRTPSCQFSGQNRIYPIHLTRRFTSCERSFNLSYKHGFKVSGGSESGSRFLGHRSFRVSTGGGSNGGAGGFGGPGGGNPGGRGGDGGGSDWSLLSWYLSLLVKYPVLTKAVTSALLTLVGDLICQLTIDKVPSLDLKRTSIFTLLGLVLVGPTLHFWYLYLSKLITKPGASGAFLRLLLDQFLFAPTFIGVFLSTLVTLEGKPSNAIPKLKQEWFSSVLANWWLWIPFQFFNFRFVPQQFQVLAANFVSLIWNVILSYKAHKEVLAK